MKKNVIMAAAAMMVALNLPPLTAHIGWGCLQACHTIRVVQLVITVEPVVITWRCTGD